MTLRHGRRIRPGMRRLGAEREKVGGALQKSRHLRGRRCRYSGCGRRDRHAGSQARRQHIEACGDSKGILVRFASLLVARDAQAASHPGERHRRQCENRRGEKHR